MVKFSEKKLRIWNILEVAVCTDMCIHMGSDDNFLLLLRSFLILKKRILDIVGKARRSPVAEIAVFYRLIKQQIHNHLLASFALVKKTKQKKTKPTPQSKKKNNLPKK